MERVREREWLDNLTAADPAAGTARLDLERLNAWMGNARKLAAVLRPSFQLAHNPPADALRGQRLLDLGAGDGQLFIKVARRLGTKAPARRTAGLLDRHKVVQAQTVAALASLGWETELLQRDVLEWAGKDGATRWDAVMANLFLHHFTDAELVKLFAATHRRTSLFVAVEPRRSAFALLFSQFVGVIGCKAVTRHDAPISVRAGFAGQELSRLWPSDPEWKLEERRAGLFGHLFVARKTGPLLPVGNAGDPCRGPSRQ